MVRYLILLNFHVFLIYLSAKFMKRQMP